MLQALGDDAQLSPKAFARYNAEGRAAAKDETGKPFCEPSPLPVGVYYDYLVHRAESQSAHTFQMQPSCTPFRAPLIADASAGAMTMSSAVNLNLCARSMQRGVLHAERPKVALQVRMSLPMAPSRLHRPSYREAALSHLALSLATSPQKAW